MIYLDTSALAKLVIAEPESAALARWLRDIRGERRCSSLLVRVELPRAVRSGGDAALRLAQAVLGDLQQLPLTPQLLDMAGALPGSLRSLDAVHLVSALQLRSSVSALVGYDRRLLDAAAAVGLPVATPGAA